MGASTSISHRHHMQGRDSKSGPARGDGMRRRPKRPKWRKKKANPKIKFKRRTFGQNFLDHVFVPVLGLGWGWSDCAASRTHSAQSLCQGGVYI